MSDSVRAALAAALSSRTAAAPTATRRNKAGREIRLLSGGVSIANIAVGEGEKRIRALLQESLARRPSQPPAEALAPEVSRLNEAPLVSESSMAKANQQGGDRAAKIVGGRDRTHGVAAAGCSYTAETLRLAALAQNPLALRTPPFVRSKMAPQAIEKPRFAEGNGAPLAALAGDESAPKPKPSPVRAPLTSRPEMAPQALENAQNAPGNGARRRRMLCEAPVARLYQRRSKNRLED